jgi:anti-sigma B factor antagonist
MLNFKSEIIEGVLVLTIYLTRATASVADVLKDKLFEEIKKGNNRIVINLNNVDFTDSSFLGALLAGHKFAVENSGGIALSDLKPQVKNVFEVTYMNKIFDVFETVEKAVKNFTSKK